ncbi:MAG: VWA domain-containing protein [Byssovorax sp.]
MLRFSFLGLLGFSSTLALLAVGCGSSTAGELASSSSGGDFAGSMPSNSGQTEGPAPGTLTAGDWDDNLNFELFRAYVSDHVETDQNAQIKAEFASADRVVIQVETEDSGPISNALVSIGDGEHTFFSGSTGSDGRVLFFPQHDGAAGAQGLTVTIQPPAGQDGVQTLVAPPPGGNDWHFMLPGAVSVAPKSLDLAFVIDATGSMGDEIGYLKSEVQGIATSVQSQFQGVSIHYGLIVYRDEGDEFVTRTFNFTDNLGAFSFSLAQQFADGGGDMPEAMDQAMELVPQLSWRSGNVARMAFLVADAPPHAEHAEAYLSAVNGLRPKGIKLYPVAASGVDIDAEYMMRVGAEATLGRYLFLTDDSGVGDPHEAPHIPCYQVQKLSKLMSRVIASELSGTRVAADPADVIRSVGSPVDGVCTMEDGTKAYF